MVNQFAGARKLWSRDAYDSEIRKRPGGIAEPCRNADQDAATWIQVGA
jgi:hypothetical protein